MIEDRNELLNKNDQVVIDSFNYVKSIKDVLFSKNRYDSSLDEFNEKLKSIFSDRKRIVNKGTILYKSRIYDEKDKYKKVINYNPNEEFHAYSKEKSFVNTKAPENRMNPNGIKCLYAASDVETTLLEIGASNNDFISVAEIVCNSDLLVADLSKYTAFADSRLDSLISLQIQSSINLDDNISGCLFPQYIAQQCMNNGYDGICYASKYVNLRDPRENKYGINYAIFNYSKCKAISSDFYQVLYREIKADRYVNIFR